MECEQGVFDGSSCEVAISVCIQRRKRSEDRDMSADEYIPLDRRFCKVEQGQSSIPSSLRDKLGGDRTWDHLVPVRPLDPSVGLSVVVVLAPSGYGKSEELKARSRYLRSSGVAAFFLRGTDVGTFNFDVAIDESESFRNWRGSSERAVFFIDAIDEVRLRGMDLEHILRVFRQEVLAQSRSSVQLVLSSRNDLWAGDFESKIAVGLEFQGSQPSIFTFNLTQLTLSDVRRYVEAKGVSDSSAFMTAFEVEGLDEVLGGRPPDVQALIAYWDRHGCFGSRSEMLEASIEALLREDNRNHADHKHVTLEDARRGLTRLGAATVLGKRPLIGIRRGSSDSTVNAERLFAGQRPIWTTQLLEMGLFVHKGLEAVQLTQGPISDYLAARWIGERVKRGWDLRKLKELLFIRPLGSPKARIPSSRATLAAWVAGIVPELREELALSYPQVLLFDADPSKLSRGDCIAALQALLAQLRDGTRLSPPDRWALRQVAAHSLSKHVTQWLKESAGSPDAQWLLLSLAKEGQYKEAIPQALALALSQQSTALVVAAAIRLVSLLGSSVQREQLLGLTEHSVELVRFELIRSLSVETSEASATLSGQQLVQVVMSLEAEDLATGLSATLAKLSLADISAILQTLRPSIVGSISDSYTEARLRIVCNLVFQWLRRNGTASPADWVLSLLLGIERHLEWGIFVPSDCLGPLKSYILESSALRQRLWEARVGDLADLEIPLNPEFGEVLADDLEWIWTLHSRSSNSSPMGALSSALFQALAKTSHQVRLALVASEETPLGFRSFLEEQDSRASVWEQEKRQEDAEELQEADARRNACRAELLPLRAEIESGRHLEALICAWNHLTEDSHAGDQQTAERTARGRRRWSRPGVQRLCELVGPELTESFIKGFQNSWRGYEPPFPTANSETHDEIVVGLTGLNLEIEQGLELENLSDHEVERAVRYAVYELGGLPSWFDELLAAHPIVCKVILARVIEIEWLRTDEHIGLISRAPYEPPRTAEMLGNLASFELERCAPANSNLIGPSISALLLTHNKTGRDVAPVLRRYVHDAANGDVAILAEWLRGWSQCAPLEAAYWMDAQLNAELERTCEVVIKVAALLEEGFSEPLAASISSWKPPELEAWVRVLYRAVRPESDLFRSGAYSPNKRDHAQDFRFRCVAQLARDPSPAASKSLRRLRSSKEMKPYREKMDAYIENQLSSAAEHLATSWSEDEILAAEDGDERQPRNNAELFAMVRRHLARVRELLENDDFSYAKLFTEKTSEREVQCWIASSLMLVSRGLYTVERESQVQDDKRMDIVINVPDVGRVPVEIKPLYEHKYTYVELQEFVSQQLEGRYMRPPMVERGIFLLVPLKLRKWRVDGRSLSFDQLRDKLAIYAGQLGRRKFKEIVIEHIDIAGARPSSRVKKRSTAGRRPRAGKTRQG